MFTSFHSTKLVPIVKVLSMFVLFLHQNSKSLACGMTEKFVQNQYCKPVKMVHSISTTTLTTISGNNGIYGSSTLCRSSSMLMNNTQMNSGGERQFLWPKCLLRSFLTNQPNRLRLLRSIRVQAGWFKRDSQERKASSEGSETVNEDILIFYFQLDLATQVQYAMNLEQYETAQQIRNKLTEIEAEVIRQREVKRGSTSKSEAQDKAISVLRLRADMQKAIEDENYALAAQFRDKISKLETESLAASATALAYDSVRYIFRLGQRVRHKLFGYRAVICGMDPVCCESSSWMEIAQVEKLSRGCSQPFYQVLVDTHEDPSLLVAYVPEDNLFVPDQPDMDRFDHPYISFLFYGMDAAGDFIPVKQLREKYNRPRHEIPLDPEDEEDNKNDT